MMRVARALPLLLTTLVLPPAAIEAQDSTVSDSLRALISVPGPSCVVHHGTGRTLRMPCLPVVPTDAYGAPVTVGHGTKSVSVEGSLVFIGNGAVLEGAADSYVGIRGDGSMGRLDVAGKIVLLSPDGPNRFLSVLSKTLPLSIKIRQAAQRGAAAVVLFSTTEDHPAYTVSYDSGSQAPEIPVISFARQSAVELLSASSVFDDRILQWWEESRMPPPSMEIHTGIQIHTAFPWDLTSKEAESFGPSHLQDEQTRRNPGLCGAPARFRREFLRGTDRGRRGVPLSAIVRAFAAHHGHTHYRGSRLASEQALAGALDGGVLDYGLMVGSKEGVLSWQGSSQLGSPLAGTGGTSHVVLTVTLFGGVLHLVVPLFPLEKLGITAITAITAFIFVLIGTVIRDPRCSCNDMVRP